MEYFSSITPMRLTNILTLLLLITVSSTSLPSQTAAIDLGVFDSVKKKAPELRSSVKEVYDSVRKKAPELRSSIKEVYDSVKQKAPELSSSVKEMYDSVKKKSPELSSSVKELFDLVKENARDLRSGKASGLSSVVREIANRYLPDGQARFVAECATLAAEEVFFKVINTVPGGVPAYNIVSKSFQSEKNSQENQGQSDQLAMLVAEFAKNGGSYAIGKGSKGIQVESQPTKYFQIHFEHSTMTRSSRIIQERSRKCELESTS